MYVCVYVCMYVCMYVHCMHKVSGMLCNVMYIVLYILCLVSGINGKLLSSMKLTQNWFYDMFYYHMKRSLFSKNTKYLFKNPHQ